MSNDLETKVRAIHEIQTSMMTTNPFLYEEKERVHERGVEMYRKELNPYRVRRISDGPIRKTRLYYWRNHD